jgi:hypothetical protein
MDTGCSVMTTIAQVQRTMLACKHAPHPIREQVSMLRVEEAAGALVGVDFAIALDELAELIDPNDTTWTAQA